VNGGPGAPAGELILLVIHWRPCRSFCAAFAGAAFIAPALSGPVSTLEKNPCFAYFLKKKIFHKGKKKIWEE
jgi:hypothetical protein